MSNWESPFVDAAAYDGMGGDVANMVKALTSGYGTNDAAKQGADAMKVEFLDQMLFDVSSSDTHIRFFKAMKKTPMHSNIAEWAERGDYGSPWGATSGAGDNPAATQADLARRVGFVKYYRTLRGVDHPTSVVKHIMTATAEEEQAGTKFLLAHLERDLFFGDSGILPSQCDGLLKLIMANGESNCNINMAGTAFVDQSQLHDAASVVGANGGIPTHLFIDPYSMNDIDKIMIGAQRFNIPTQNSQGGVIIDAGVAGFRNAWGTTSIEPDIFLAPERGWIARKTDPLYKAPVTARGGSSDAPAPGVAVIGAATAGGNTGTIPAGTYQYRVSAINSNGESAASAATAVVVGANEIVTLTVTHADSTITGFRVYRSAVDGSAADCRFLYHFAAEVDGSTDWVDNGYWVPGTTCAFLVDINPMTPAVDWMQLLPMMKMQLGIRRPRVEWLQMIYGFMRLALPWRAAVIRNILPSNIKASGWNPLGAV